MKRTTFKVPKMDCAAEEQMVRLKLQGEPSVKSLEFDISERKVIVLHEDDIQPVETKLATLNLGSQIVQTETGDFNLKVSDEKAEKRLLWLVLGLNAGAFVIEIITGFLANSMGLVADSLDMLADAFVYSLSLFAVGKAASSKKRVAGLSGYLQLILAIGGLIEVVRRFMGNEGSPDYILMIGISLLALCANLASLYLLQKAKSKEAHMQASWIFTSNDVLVNIGVIVAGALVYLTQSKYPDLIVGGLVFIIVARGAFKILKLSK